MTTENVDDVVVGVAGVAAADDDEDDGVKNDVGNVSAHGEAKRS